MFSRLLFIKKISPTIILTFASMIYAIICITIYPIHFKPLTSGLDSSNITGTLFNFLSDATLAFLTIIAIFGLQETKHLGSLYSNLFIGFSLLFLSLVTDTLDEIVYFPKAHTAIFENIPQIIGFLLISRSIMSWYQSTQKKQIFLEQLAQEDPLTHINNRRSFLNHFHLESEQAIKYQLPLSIMLIDINRFKFINDHYGHLCGDYILIEVADTLKRSLRRSDIVCRWGGDEFVVLLHHSNLAKAKIVRSKLDSIIRNIEIVYAQQTIPISVSIGVATFNHGDKIDDLIYRADKDMYEQKSLSQEI